MITSHVLAQGTWTQYQPRITQIKDISVKENELWCSSARKVFRVNPSTIEYEEMFNSGNYCVG